MKEDERRQKCGLCCWISHLVGHAREGECLPVGRKPRVMALACCTQGSCCGWWEVEVEVEKGIWWGDAGEDWRARQGEGMWEGLGGQPARGHARVWSLCRKHTPADAGGVCRRSDGWAAGRYLYLSDNDLDLNDNDLVSLDADVFAGLTSLE